MKRGDTGACNACAEKRRAVPFPFHGKANRWQTASVNVRRNVKTPDSNTAAGLAPDTAPRALTVDAARRAILRLVTPIDGIETIGIADALGRVLADAVISPLNVPAHDNAAMDGYAFAGAALAGGSSIELRVVGTALAGAPFEAIAAPGTCVRIMTGAPLPAGCDTVIPQEQVERVGMQSAPVARFAAKAIQIGQHVRHTGEDLAAGKPALHAGKWLRPADLGLLASLGIGEVRVRRRLRVAFLSTGSELRPLGVPLDAGAIYDSNRYTVFGMLRRLGVDTLDLGIVKDDEAALEAALRRASAQADAIITSGGVSVGEADFTKVMMARLGEVAFWQIAMRPGRPLAFGHIDGTVLFGLPGNPVATMVAFYHLVRDALLVMMGADAAPLPLFKARSAQPLRKRAGRTEYLRGIVGHALDGLPEVTPTGNQGSGILRSMSEANCFIVLPHERGDVAAGETVDILPFEGLT